MDVFSVLPSPPFQMSNSKALFFFKLCCFRLTMYWVGQKVCVVLSCEIKDTLFIFTNNFIDLYILSMLTIFPMVEH